MRATSDAAGARPPLAAARPPEPPPRRPVPLWWAAAAGAVAAFAVLAVLPSTAAGWTIALQILELAAVVVTVVAAARMRGAAAAVWRFVAAFAALSWIGDSIYVYQEHVLGDVPEVGAADVFYLIAYPMAFVGLALLVRRRHAGRRDVVASSLVIVLALLAYMSALVIGPSVSASTTSTLGTVVTSLYPLMDVAVLAVLIRLLGDLKSWSLPLVMLAASFALYLAADIAFTYAVLDEAAGTLSSPLGASYLLPLVGLSLAATAPGAELIAGPAEGGDLSPRLRGVVLAVSALAVPLLVTVHAWLDGDVMLAFLAALGVVVVALVVWQLRRLVLAIAAAQEEYRLLAENASDVVYRTDADGVLTWMSPSVVDLLGFRPEELVGSWGRDLLHPDDAHVRDEVVDQHSLEPIFYEVRFRRADGSYRWIGVTGRWMKGADGALVGRIGSMRDIDTEVHARSALERSERQFRLAMQSAPGGMAVVGLDRRFASVNPALCRMLGRDAAWFEGRSVADILDPADDALDRSMRDALLADRLDSVTVDKRLRAAGGGTVLVEHSVGVLRDLDGTPISFVSQFIDVTEARRTRDALRFLATHDPLTRLSNRADLMASLETELERTPRTGTRLGVVFLDLDGFKEVNDTYGHAAGDEVIVTVARRLRALVRDADVVARFGGDEFVLLLPGLHDVDDALRIAEIALDALREPAAIAPDGTPIAVGASAGVALAVDSDDGDHVIARADIAMFRAKTQGLGVAAWDPALDAIPGQALGQSGGASA